ncbi:MAG: alpha-glucan family phosphorylase [Candidatus Levyibacteriota bacterium]
MNHLPLRTLPEGLEALRDAALDLRWTWNHATDAMWRMLDRDLWERTRNPWAILQYTSRQNLERLAEDRAFAEALERVTEGRQEYLGQHAWCAQAYPDLEVGAIAYFSMEFGLSEAVPLYAGGLGVLAGDYLKTASDLGIPVTGVGLLYQEGYFRQMVDASGRQREAYPYNDPASLPIRPASGPAGEWLRIEVRLPGRALHLRVWRANVGRVRLYLLDSNDPLNGPGDRGITAKLYGGDVELRLLQEMALGLGGWAMLEKLGIEAQVCHLNEAHTAFAAIERARRYMNATGSRFDEAWWATRAGNVFTSHTPVAAGFDAFSPGLIERYFRDYRSDLHLSSSEFLGLGRRNTADQDEPFNMAYLAMRGCARANAVSRLHGEVSRHLFGGLFAGWPESEVPLGSVTNGIHVPSWDSPSADRLWTSACGKGRWLGAVENLARGFGTVDDETLWKLAAEERRDLVAYARERLARQLGERGASAEKIREAGQVLDPNILTLGFARRFAEYKRPNLLLRDRDRLTRLLLNPRFPVQIIVAGKAHPQDEAGKELVRAWLDFTNRSDVRARAVFLEDYDIALAQQLVQGVDLWINTPRRPWEACGTSGMKVLVNGGLNLSTLDGWWAEAYQPEVGWAIAAPGTPVPDQDAADAGELYRVLEQEVVPIFYARDARGIPAAWVERMRASNARLTTSFSSNRMLREYLDQYYRPAAGSYRRRSDAQGKLARELSAWHAALVAHWHEVHFGQLTVERRGDRWSFDAPVYLGGLSPDAVKVELCAEPDASQPAVRQAMARGGGIPGSVNGFVYSATVPASRPDWHFTPRITAHQPEACLPMESALVLWQR